MLLRLIKVPIGLAMFLSIYSSIIYAQDSVSACGHHDYPPWNWKKDQKIVGVCAEVVETLFAKLGVKVDLSYSGPWKRCQKNIETGLVDINICSFINPTRKQYSKFITTPMGYNENVIFVQKDKEFPFNKWSDLTKKNGVMVIGVSIGKEFDRFLEDNINITRVGTNRQVFRFLGKGRADFAPYGRHSGRVLLRSINLHNDFTDLTTPVSKGKLYISMSNKSKHLTLLPLIELLMQQPNYSDWVNELLEKYTTMYADDYVRSLQTVEE
jgi:polar amino acid transport system substrate-binding protein